jgi:16S rRNA C967 or C1407 C5-methylase (RsmB/RsmF family)
VIALIPKTAPAVLVVVPGLVQNAIVAERSATLRAHALRHPEAVREAMAEVVVEEEEEDMVVSVEVEVEAKKPGRRSFQHQRGVWQVADYPQVTRAVG